jgi:hypothetical protein
MAIYLDGDARARSLAPHLFPQLCGTTRAQPWCIPSVVALIALLFLANLFDLYLPLSKGGKFSQTCRSPF